MSDLETSIANVQELVGRLKAWAEEHDDETTMDYERQNHVADCLDAAVLIQAWGISFGMWPATPNIEEVDDE